MFNQLLTSNLLEFGLEKGIVYPCIFRLAIYDKRKMKLVVGVDVDHLIMTEESDRVQISWKTPVHDLPLETSWVIVVHYTECRRGQKKQKLFSFCIKPLTTWMGPPTKTFSVSSIRSSPLSQAVALGLRKEEKDQ